MHPTVDYSLENQYSLESRDVLSNLLMNLVFCSFFNRISVIIFLTGSQSLTSWR